MPKTDREDPLHDLAANGTERSGASWGWTWQRLGGAEVQNSSRVELDSHPIGFGGGMVEAVIADRAQSGGQHVAQVAAYELKARQGEFSTSIGLRAVFPAEGHRVWNDPEHAGVSDSGARDIGAQILQSAGSGTGRLDMDTPVFTPDLRINRPIVLLEQSVEVLAEGRLQVRQVQKELWLSDAHELALLIEPGTWDQTMDVRMELQLLGPGVQDGDEAIYRSAQGFVSCQLLAQRTGGSFKE